MGRNPSMLPGREEAVEPTGFDGLQRLSIGADAEEAPANLEEGLVTWLANLGRRFVWMVMGWLVTVVVLAWLLVLLLLLILASWLASLLVGSIWLVVWRLVFRLSGLGSQVDHGKGNHCMCCSSG